MNKFEIYDYVRCLTDHRNIVYQIVEIHDNILSYYLETDNPDGKDYLFVKFKDEENWSKTTSNGYFIAENLPKKYDSDKPRMDLIRPEFTLALGEALAYGAKKYEEPRGETPNYLKGNGFNYSTIIASLERHIAAFKMGQDIDEESSLSHLAHAAVNLMFLHTYSLCEKGVDDRVILDKVREYEKYVNETEKGFDCEGSERQPNTEAKK